MHSNLAEQWAQTQKELAQRVAEAELMGDYLIELGKRFKQQPWLYAIGWLPDTSPAADTICLIEPEIEQALDKHRLMWLLDDIRILRRREAELRKLVAA